MGPQRLLAKRGPIGRGAVAAAKPDQGDQVDLLVTIQGVDEIGELLLDRVVRVVLEDAAHALIGEVGSRIGLDHIDLTVNDLRRSEAFYARVLEALGFARFAHPVGHPSWSNGRMSLTLRAAAPESAGAPFDRYRVGLHHLAFKARERADVDALHRLLVEAGLPVLDPPAEYPEYGERYYAVFFADPDGVKLEVVYEARANP